MRHLIVTLAVLLAFGLAVSEANAAKLFGWEFNTDGEGPDIITGEVPGSEAWSYEEYVPEFDYVGSGVWRFVTGPPNSPNRYAYNYWDFVAPLTEYVEVQTRMKVYDTVHGNHIGMRFILEGTPYRAQFAVSNTNAVINEYGPSAEIIADDDFHNYRFVWDLTAPAGEQTKFYMDGVLLLQADAQDKGGGTPYERAIFQMGDATGDGYADWEVDWVRVYDAPEGPVDIPGDANQDGQVTDADAAILATHWQQCEVGWSEGDFNSDGCVTDADAAILATHWQEGVTEGATAVPEPGMIALLAAGLVCLLLWRRRGSS